VITARNTDIGRHGSIAGAGGESSAQETFHMVGGQTKAERVSGLFAEKV